MISLLRARLSVVWRLGALAFVLLASLPAVAAQRYPIIFAHGFGVPAELYEKVVPVRKLAKKMGYELYVAQTPIGSSLAERARILRDEINRLVPHGPFHIVAHSMGGLDARLAIHKYGFGERCLSLTTLATPHRGSHVADYVWEKLHQGEKKTRLVTHFMKLVDNSVAAVRDLTTDRLVNAFNEQVEDDPRVRYFSMAFYIPDPVPLHSFIPLLWLSNKIIEDRGGGDNDGMVSVDSAIWGEFLGSFPGDHWAETTQVPFRGGLDYKEVFGKSIENLELRF